MSSATDKLNQVVADLQAVVSELSNEPQPSVGDQVLAAVEPVLEAAGWQKPQEAESPAEDQSPADASEQPADQPSDQQPVDQPAA